MYNVVIGLDISKATLDAATAQQGAEIVHHDAFLNRSMGFKQLLKWVDKRCTQEDKVLFCMEHTGYYSRQLCKFLEQQNRAYVLVNPLLIKRSMGIRREKSDKADALMIASFALRFQDQLQLDAPMPDLILDLQLLLAHRKRLLNKRLDFQRQHIQIKHCLSGKMAKKIMRSIKQQQKHLLKEFETFETIIDEFVHQHTAILRNYDLLQSIPGVGRISALYTIVYTHNFTRFNCPRKFACYAGVAPFKNQSGSSIRKRTSVSFYANKTIKEIIHLGALSAVRTEPTIKAYYQRKVEEGKPKMSVINAVRNKIIHRMFAVIRRQSPYVVQPVF